MSFLSIRIVSIWTPFGSSRRFKSALSCVATKFLFLSSQPVPPRPPSPLRRSLTVARPTHTVAQHAPFPFLPLQPLHRLLQPRPQPLLSEQITALQRARAPHPRIGPPLLQQTYTHLALALEDRTRQRRLPAVVAQVRVRAVREQEPGEGEVAVVRGEHEEGVAGAVAEVDGEGTGLGGEGRQEGREVGVWVAEASGFEQACG